MWDGHMDGWGSWWVMVPLMVLSWTLVVLLAVVIYRWMIVAPERREKGR
jgi:hypothetical protein